MSPSATTPEPTELPIRETENSNSSTSPTPGVEMPNGVKVQSNDHYILGRGYASSCRLNLFHFLWKQVLGFNIHPRIPTSGFRRIVDVATGTAIWPLDVASECPDSEVDGLDISLEQCPRSDFMPRVHALGTWNIFEDPPQELHGKYDILHVRLIIFVVRDNDPRPIIRNLMKLLKPGGWLQWDELDLPGSHLERGPGNDVPAPAAEACLKRVHGVSVNHWASNNNLPTILTEEGFVAADRDVYIIPPPWVKMFSDAHLMLEEEMPMPTSEAKTQKLCEIAALHAESKKGAVLSTPLAVTVARKPFA